MESGILIRTAFFSQINTAQALYNIYKVNGTRGLTNFAWGQSMGAIPYLVN